MRSIQKYKNYEAMLGIAAEMIWDKILKKERLKTIFLEIDEALDKKDKEAFMRLVAELKQLKAE